MKFMYQEIPSFVHDLKKVVEKVDKRFPGVKLNNYFKRNHFLNQE